MPQHAKQRHRVDRKNRSKHEINKFKVKIRTIIANSKISLQVFKEKLYQIATYKLTQI